MGSLSSFNRGLKYLLCVIDVFTKYAWAIPLKNKKTESVLHGFIKTINESKFKSRNLWVDKGKKNTIT